MADELLWAYCVLRAGDPAPAGVPAVEPAAAVEAVEAEGLVALVSRVPDAQFSAEPLRENLNDLRWLERVARAHEAVLDQALAEASIVPLRLCTLYESPERVREMLLNAAYLVEAQRVADLRERAAELAERHAAVGARIELTGPWPPYNFVPDGEPGVAA